MITWVRTAGIQDGKLDEAFGWAVKVAGYINKKFKGANIQVVRNIGGPVYQLHWVGTYETLAAFESQWKQIEGDRGFRSLLTEIRKKRALVGPSVADSLYESIS